MADVVQFRMERMSDELDELEQRGLFSRAEIAEIVRRRREFEYRIKRRSSLKQDYISYIEYEKKLDALRGLRKRAIIGRLGQEEQDGKKKKNKRRGNIWKKSISDKAGVRRILHIYRQATSKFKGELDLWFGYLEFCKKRHRIQMKEVLDKAIKYHPKVPEIWIYAAAWEFDQNMDVAAARTHMQNGLSCCPTSEDLWIEYLRFELTNLSKSNVLEVSLDEDVKALTGDSRANEQGGDEKNTVMPLNEQQETSLWEKRENLKRALKYFKVIYYGATKAMPSSMRLRKRFVEILNVVDLPHSQNLRKEIMKHIKSEFADDEDYWDWLAKLQISDVKGQNQTRKEIICKLDKAAEIYEEGLRILPSVKLFTLYAKFWLELMVPAGEDFNLSHNGREFDAADLSSRLLKVYEKADMNGCLTDDLATQYVSYLQIWRLEEARSLVEHYCNGKFSTSSKLWNLRASIEMKWLTKQTGSLSEDGFRFMFGLLQNVLRRLPVSESKCLWLMTIQMCANRKKHIRKLVSILLAALTEAGGSENGYSIASAIVNLVLQNDGIEHARKIYKQFLALPCPSIAFFRHCIEVESNLACVEVNDGFLNARKLYDLALSVYGKNRELWKGYYTLEIKFGTSESANSVHWRAQNATKEMVGLQVECLF